MRALTIRQPYAWAICAKYKDVENRSWAPWLDPGERFAIHAAVAKPNADDLARTRRRLRGRAAFPEQFVRGAIVAIARVEKVVARSRSAWFTGPLGWNLADVVSLQEPVACKGALGLWRLPGKVQRAVERQLGRPRGRGASGSR